jgi:P-aminobenzoate N-oxygenase AurF
VPNDAHVPHTRIDANAEGRFGLAGVLANMCWLMGAALLAALPVMAWTRMVKRWRRNMDVSDDPAYVATLAGLSEASVRRHFNPYTDIDWDAPEFAVSRNDPRWVLSPTDPLGRHPWYQAQPLEKQIEIGLWRQANTAKITLQLESILIRGLMNYTFWAPNGSPEYRYCMHETVEECNHGMMFQELVNRIGVDVPGMPRWLRWISPVLPLYAGPLPGTFFFGVLAGELPIHNMQKSMMREDTSSHPIMEKVMAIHVAEEARHISFADQFLTKRVPQMVRRSRFVLSLYVPIVMRVLCHAIVVPSRGFFRKFDIPRSVRKELFFNAPDSRQALRHMYGDVRMLCDDVGLMNPPALMLWRICKINGQPSRYRGEPQRAHLPSPATAA